MSSAPARGTRAAAPPAPQLQAYIDACLDTVGRMAASDYLAFYLVADDGDIATFLHPAALPEVQAAYNDHYWRHDPLYPAHALRRGSPVLSLCGLGGGNAVYRNFLRASDLGDIADIYVRLNQRAVAGISLLRRSHRPPFSSGELELLKGLMPLLEFSAARSGAFAAAAPVETEALTPRERELLHHLRRGLGNAEIAEALGISLATVKTHVKHVLDKVGARNRAELLAKLYLQPSA